MSNKLPDLIKDARTIGDRMFTKVVHPPKKSLRYLEGMVITGVHREKELGENGSVERLVIEVDNFANLDISVVNGECVVQIIPTTKPRITLLEKVELVVNKHKEHIYE